MSESKSVMPSSVDFSAIDPEVYFNHVATNPQCHFDLAKEYEDEYHPGQVRKTLELQAFTETVRANLQTLIEEASHAKLC